MKVELQFDVSAGGSPCSKENDNQRDDKIGCCDSMAATIALHVSTSAKSAHAAEVLRATEPLSAGRNIWFDGEYLGLSTRYIIGPSVVRIDRQWRPLM